MTIVDIINKKRLVYSGTAISYLGHCILWYFLTTITFGIYGFWVNIAIKKWKVKHTHFVK